MHTKISFNGKCFDDEIMGFHTLDVDGRQFPTIDLITQNNIYDGAELIRQRMDAKVITVSFCMYANDKADMLQKQTKLLTLLVEGEATLEFDDEPGCYYKAVFQGAELDESVTARSGRLSFICVDPYRYKRINEGSRAYWDDEAGSWCFDINNDGNVPVPVRYALTFPRENGYIGLASEYGAMEFGNIEETDTAQGEASEMLLDLHGADIYGAFNGHNPITTGAFAYGGTFVEDGDGYIYANSYGSGSSWNGAGGQIDIPADANGEVGAESFKVSFMPYFATHKTYAVTGDMEVVVGDETGALLCDIHIVKSSTSNNKAKLKFKIAGQGDVWSYEYECRGDNGLTRLNANEVVFSKTGELFEVSFAGKKQQYRVPGLAEKKAKTLNVFIGRYKTNTAVYYMRLKYLRFVKNNVHYDYDVPNRYQPGDKVVIDGESTVISVNGVPMLGDEVIGSKYFLAPPGLTKVYLSLSSFCDISPTSSPDFWAYIVEAFK